jgi:hypothetical protein
MRFFSITVRHPALLSVSLLLVGQVYTSIAQPVTNSPYARYGVGNNVAGANVRSTGLGNMGVAIREDSIPFVVNFLNPASYTSLRFTSFDVGAYASVGTLSSASQQEQVNRFNLSYLTLGFPITKWWGGAFGIREYSSSKYSVTDMRQYANSDTSNGDIRYKFQGDGGLNQVFIGIGMKPFKNLSVGINVSYLFGKLNQLQRVEFPSSGLFNVRTDNITNVGGIYLDYGLQYSARIAGRHALVAGVTFAHPMQVGASTSRLSRTYLLSTFDADIFRDTILFTENSGSSIKMPWKYGVGLTWKIGDRWMFGAEFNQQLWSQYVNPQGGSDSLSDSWIVRGGVEFKPGGDALNRGFLGYFKRIQYRVGGFYGGSEYSIRDNQLSEYGMTIGFGLPMARRKAGNDLFVQSMINVSVEWGQRGTISNNLLLEDYWVFRLGFTLNDRWFIKRKYD